MEESCEADDSLLSLPGPSNLRSNYHTPPNPVGLGIHPRIVPPHLPEEQESLESGEGEWTEGASPAPESEAGDSGEDEEGEEQEEEEGASETSSTMFDREGDPEGWAKRLDELAGVLEVGEEEARAMRWGPAFGKERDAQDLPLEEFRNLINHHLSSTEWRYTSPTLFPTMPGRPTANSFFVDGLSAVLGELHPIRVEGRDWIGQNVGELERRMEGLGGERQLNGSTDARM